MKTKTTFSHQLPALCVLTSALCLPAFAQGTAFTYQGRLNDNGSPANGTYDLVFTIYDLPTGSGAFANQTNAAVAISNGLFTVTLDFVPGIFTGPERWLEIAVRTNGGGSYSNLVPRQKITATPYAITASNLSGTISAGQLSGVIPLAQLPAAVVTNNQSGVNFTGSFSGNGAGLSNVTAVATNAWRLDGNAGTTPGANYLGTTDNQPLELKVNGTRALRIEPHGGAAPSLAGGYLQNSVAGYHGAVVAGGGTSASANYALGNYAFVGAGHGGQAADYSAVVAGAYNVSPGLFSFIGSGQANTNLANYAFIGGGTNNLILTNSGGSVIGGGQHNVIQAVSLNSVIAGGAENVVGMNSGGGTIAGGSSNEIEGGAGSSSIGGGAENLIQVGSTFSALGGGLFNTIATFSSKSTIGGGYANRIENHADESVIGGGYFNSVQDYSSDSTIGGGSANTIQPGAYYSTIGGGNQNTSSGTGATVGGGYRNASIGGYTTVGGGGFNTSSGLFATVGGGEYNTASGYASFVGGGGSDGIIDSGNLAAGPASVIGGGFGNTTAGLGSTVGGGRDNHATNNYAMIPGGAFNTAGGQFSFAAGRQAQALHDGSYVWADSQNAYFNSTASNQFLIRASGGVGIGTTAPGRALQVGDAAILGSQGMIRLSSRTPTGNNVARTWDVGVPQTGDDASGTGYSFVIKDTLQGSATNTTPEFMIKYVSGYVGLGTNVPSEKLHVIGNILASGTITPNSDRNAKTEFEPVDAAAILQRVAALPIQRWRFKAEEPGVKHVGPMAQDFHAAFGLGAVPTAIATVDADGVALAAIQGLNQKVEEQRAELRQKQTEITELKQRLEKLERFINPNGGAK